MAQAETSDPEVNYIVCSAFKYSVSRSSFEILLLPQLHLLRSATGFMSVFLIQQ